MLPMRRFATLGGEELPARIHLEGSNREIERGLRAQLSRDSSCGSARRATTSPARRPRTSSRRASARPTCHVTEGIGRYPFASDGVCRTSCHVTSFPANAQKGLERKSACMRLDRTLLIDQRLGVIAIHADNRPVRLLGAKIFRIAPRRARSRQRARRSRCAMPTTPRESPRAHEWRTSAAALDAGMRTRRKRDSISGR